MDKFPYLEDKALQQYQELFALYQAAPNQSHQVSSLLEEATVTLSPKALRLALLFLNALNRTPKGQYVLLKRHHDPLKTVVENSQRYRDLLAYYDTAEFWNTETRAVLIYLFQPPTRLM